MNTSLRAVLTPEVVIAGLLCLGLAPFLDDAPIDAWTSEAPAAEPAPPDALVELQLAPPAAPRTGQLLVVGFDADRTSDLGRGGLDVPARFSWVGGEYDPAVMARHLRLPAGTPLVFYAGVDADRDGRLNGDDLVAPVRPLGTTSTGQLRLGVDLGADLAGL